MREYIWIPESAIRAIHGELLSEHGGSDGIIQDEGALSATLARPVNLLAYEESVSIHRLAASYGYGFVKNHVFVDGNKRIGLTAIDVFLRMNGYELTAEETQAVFAIEAVGNDAMSEEELASWIEHHSQPLQAP